MFNFLKSYSAAKSDFLSRSPKGKWLFVRDVAISLLRLTGAAALDPTFEVYWYSYFPGVTAIIGFISFLYTIWYYSSIYPLKGYLFLPLYAIVIPVSSEKFIFIRLAYKKLFVSFHFTCHNSCCTQQSTILYVMIMVPQSRKEFRSHIYFVGERVYTDIDENSNASYIKALDQSAIKLFTSTAKTVAIVVVSMIIYLTFPIIVYIQSNELHLPIPILVPFTDLETKNGLIINLWNQSSIAVMIIVGNIGIEMITCMLKNSVWATTVAIGHTIDEISAFFEEPEPPSESVFDRYIRNLSIQVRDLDRYVLI